MQRIAGTLVFGLLLAPAGLCAQGDARPNGGSVSTAQAQRGENTFKQVCAWCHATSQFAAAEYARSWSERPVFELFDQLRTTMPQDGPGRLSAQEYVDVVMYLFKLNGAAAGEQELTADEAVLKQTRIKLQSK